MDYTGPPMSQFLFPMLKTSEILSCLEELGLEVSKVELTEPHRHKDKIKSLFTFFLEMCSGITETDLEISDDVKTQIESLRFSELYNADGFSDIKYFQYLRKCLKTCGVYDFGWKDLHMPNSKRLRQQLSALINLVKFRAEQLQILAELNEPRAEILVNLEDINNEHLQLQSHLEEARAKSEEDYEKLEAIKQECEVLTQKIAQANKLNIAKREESTNLKRKANDLKDELATATWALEEAEAEEQRLRSQVVSSPDRRQRELNIKREALDKERDECEHVEEALQATKTKCSHVADAIKAVQSAVTAAEAVKEHGDKYTAVANQLENSTRQLQISNQQVTEVHEKVVLAERDVNRTQEKLTNLQKQSKSKLEQAQESLQMAKSKMHSVEKDRQDSMKRIEDGAVRVRELESHIEDERIQAKEEIDVMIADFQEMEGLVMAKFQKRMQAIGAAN